MRNIEENPIKLEPGETLPHEEFVDRWIETYASGDARVAASILLDVNRKLTDMLKEVTGKPAHELFGRH